MQTHVLTDDQVLSIIKFIVIAFLAPLLYVLVNIIFRRILDGREAANFYCGLDLSLASLIAVGMWMFEPPTRFLPKISVVIDAYKQQCGMGTAAFVDLILVLLTFAIQYEFIHIDLKVADPTPMQKVKTGLKNLVVANLLGLFAFISTAFLIRG